jgi:hypothetical protein
LQEFVESGGIENRCVGFHVDLRVRSEPRKP